MSKPKCRYCGKHIDAEHEAFCINWDEEINEIYLKCRVCSMKRAVGKDN